ncbi:MAG: hypothetical protein J6C37_09160 [Roseburia sp.]|nr:hypothetical protein [Roseburia sp.]
MSVYLAIDLGTTGCRSILFNSELEQVSDGYREYGLITPKEKWVEQDANLWWSLTIETAKEAINQSNIKKEEIKGISVSSQGITLVPVDEELQPLHNALSWLDMRAESQTEQIKKDFGLRDMFTLTGKPIDAAYLLPKLLWLKEELSEIYEKAWKFLMPMEFLVAKLTGKCVTDHSMASGTLMYDIKNKTWSRQVLDKYKIPEDKFPELRWSGEVAGTLLPEVARELGLSETCVVAVGAQDQRCAALGAGLKKGVVTLSLGTAGAICKYWNEAKTEGDTRIGWSAYVNENSWVTEGVIDTAGSSLRWLRDTMYPGCSYGIINAEAEEASKRGSGLLFYPYLSGASSPDRYPDSEGCFYGASLATGRGDFALSVMEAIAFQTKIIMEAMGGCEDVHTLVLFGGGSKSPLWCQIIADVLGMEIVVPATAEAAGAGAAILAGIAVGEFERDLCPSLVHKTTYKPGERKEMYRKKYERYREIEYKLWRA